ncbi:hypothetical protein LguiA_002926 [Lonicera macranthoides]
MAESLLESIRSLNGDDFKMKFVQLSHSHAHRCSHTLSAAARFSPTTTVRLSPTFTSHGLTLNLSSPSLPTSLPPPPSSSCSPQATALFRLLLRLRFESSLTILNNGLDELKSFRVFVGFQHDELLVSASNAVLADGTSLPALVGNGTLFAGYPSTDLRPLLRLLEM